jgi:hypothetical protein
MTQGFTPDVLPRMTQGFAPDLPRMTQGQPGQPLYRSKTMALPPGKLAMLTDAFAATAS